VRFILHSTANRIGMKSKSLAFKGQVTIRNKIVIQCYTFTYFGRDFSKEEEMDITSVIINFYKFWEVLTNILTLNLFHIKYVIF
jgi:hypothetical protein